MKHENQKGSRNKLEFEPIYREEAKGRMLAGKKTLSTNGAEGKGQSREFMARDSAASEHSVQRILCKGVSNQIFSAPGRRTDLLPPGGRLPTFKEYCSKIGMAERTAFRWIANVFGPQRLASPLLPKLESQVIYADPLATPLRLAGGRPKIQI